MRKYKVYDQFPDSPYEVSADAISINQGVMAFFANPDDLPSMGGPAPQPRLVLALAPGQWTRVEEVTE